METVNSQTEELLVKKYIEQLTAIEQKVLKIAQDQLKSSFNIEKSIGFINWSKHNTEPV